MIKFASYLEHTLLKPDAQKAQIEHLCSEARAHGVHGVCVNGARVQEAYALLEETEIKVIAVVGFPLGASGLDVKRFEAETAIEEGAQEVDMVMNIGWLKEGRDRAVLREIRDVVASAEDHPVKVIVETGLLTDAELEKACKLVVESGAQFVKTSTGFGPRGASIEDIQRIRQWVGNQFGIKASGGIRTYRQAKELIEAGANRIGTSAAVDLVQEAAKNP